MAEILKSLQIGKIPQKTQCKNILLCFFNSTTILHYTNSFHYRFVLLHGLFGVFWVK